MSVAAHEGELPPEPETAQRPGLGMGLFKSISGLMQTLVVIAQTRLELLTTEVQEEVGRVATLVVWAFVALLTALIGLFFVGLTVVLVYWDTHRVLAATLVTVTFLAGALVAGLVLMAKIKARPRFLDATLSELAKDADALKAKL